MKVKFHVELACEGGTKAYVNGLGDLTKMATMQIYRNDLKFSDTQVWANSADPDQTAPRGAV